MWRCSFFEPYVIHCPSDDLTWLYICRVRFYEGKLATLTIINGALQTENEELRERIAAADEPTSNAEEELQDLKEEFTRRLGAAQKTISDLKACSFPSTPLLLVVSITSPLAYIFPHC